MDEIVKQTVNKGGNPNWKPGVSGNPNGRPRRGDTFADAIREGMEAKAVGDKTWRAVIVDKLRDLAAEGDMVAIKYLMDRVDGSPTSKQEVKEVQSLDDSVTDQELVDFLEKRMEKETQG